MKLKQYVKPASLQEAIALLRSTEGPVTLLAGGTDVLVYGREGDDRYADHTVVDIYGLPELRGIEETEDALLIGAGTTHSEIEQSPLVQRHADVLACACRTVGSLQIRNHATIGGNIGNASPAADSFAALAVLDAELEINRLGEVRREPLSQVIARPYRTTLSDRDIITRIIVKKLPEGTVCDFYKLARRRALAISRMTIATVLRTDAAGVVQDFRHDHGRHVPAAHDVPGHQRHAHRQAAGRRGHRGGGQGAFRQDPRDCRYPRLHEVQTARVREAVRTHSAPTAEGVKTTWIRYN